MLIRRIGLSPDGNFGRLLSNDVGYQEEGYFNALVNMFEQAIKITRQLSAGDRDALIVRFDRVRTISHNLGYGVGDDMDSLLANNIGT